MSTSTIVIVLELDLICSPLLVKLSERLNLCFLFEDSGHELNERTSFFTSKVGL
jgi:hypothetical protein